jgi:hypothetical protein
VSHEELRVYSRASHRKIPDSPSGGEMSFFLSRGRLEREGAGAARFGFRIEGHHFQTTWLILLQASPPFHI